MIQNKKSKILLIILIIILLIITFLKNQYEILSLLNTHSLVGKNYINKIYSDKLQKYNTHCQFNKYLPHYLIHMIKYKDLTIDKFKKYTNNFTLPLCIKSLNKKYIDLGGLLNSQINNTI